MLQLSFLCQYGVLQSTERQKKSENIILQKDSIIYRQLLEIEHLNNSSKSQFPDSNNLNKRPSP